MFIKSDRFYLPTYFLVVKSLGMLCFVHICTEMNVTQFLVEQPHATAVCVVVDGMDDHSSIMSHV